MSLNANRKWKTTRVGLSLIALALVVLFALPKVRARRAVSSSEPALPKTTILISAQQRVADFESELITITPHGFEPQEITRPAGRVLLMVDNQSELDVMSLRLTREAGPRINEIRVPREQPNWSEAVDLNPGRYVLTDAQHPEWQCRITITAR